MIYDRFHTRDINELSGLAKKMPRLAFFFVFFMLSSIGQYAGVEWICQRILDGPGRVHEPIFGNRIRRLLRRRRA